MLKAEEGPKLSQASLVCSQSLPSKVLSSSRSVGWTSVLVDRHWVEPTDEPFETLATPDHTLVVMTRGEQNLEALKNGRWHSSSYRVGMTGVTSGGETVRLRRRVRHDRSSFEKVNLYIPQQFFGEAAEHLSRPGQRAVVAPFRTSPFEDSLITETTIALLRGMEAGASDFFAQSAMYWLATHLLSSHARSASPQDDLRRPGVLSDRRLNRVVEFMRSNIGKTLTLDQLAAEAGISKFHFTRLFRDTVGVGPHAFLVGLRIEAAKRLLQTSRLPVSEVAVRCGFNGPSHFSAAFTHHAGMSPSRYRDRSSVMASPS